MGVRPPGAGGSTPARIALVARLRVSSTVLLTAEALLVLFEQGTGTDPLPDAIDVAICLVGCVTAVLVAIGSRAERQLAGTLAADAEDLASRRERDEAAVRGAALRRARIQQVLDSEAHPAIVFQPIVDLRSGATVGYEALSRFEAGAPDEWFADAEAVGLGVELELKAIRRALERLDELPGEAPYLSVNCSPAAMLTDDFLDVVTACPPGRVVIELTEHSQVDDYDACRRALATLRARGTRLAIDDLGAGYASLRHVIELRPDLLKLDRSLVAVGDSSLDAAIGTLVTLGRLLGAAIVAEGIEDAATVRHVRELGVDLGQGWYYGRPAARPVPAKAAPAAGRPS